ncbi:MAG TPA: hypothetical protein EYH00_04485 [Archaeoglobus profundus]|nr:hypothetical protein [Archaeoglobus profundus]
MKHKHVFPCGGAVLHYNMALCYQDLGEYDKAIKSLAIALNKGFIDVKE